MAAPGVAVPGSVVAIGSQVSPAGAQGIQGPAAVSANANNKATLGSDSLILVQGTAAGVAATTHAQTVSGDDPQLTNSRAPTAHAATHLSAGSDPVAAATATAAGLVPTPPNNTTTFLRGDATFATPTGIVPSAHASTHVTGGSDIIVPAGTSTAGLLKQLSGNTTDFVDGTNTCQNLVNAVQPTIWSARLRSFNALGNPTFEVDQRNVGAVLTNPPNGTLVQDRWVVSKGTSTLGYTIQRSGVAPGTLGSIPVPGTNFGISQNFLRITLTVQQTTLAAGDHFRFFQILEGPRLRELSTDVHSLSLLVRSSVAGLQFCAALRDNPTTKSLIKLCTIPTANVWTLITLPNLPVWASGGNFAVAPGLIGYELDVCLAAGSSFLTTPDIWANGSFLGVSGMSNFAASPVNSTFDIAYAGHETGALCTTPQDCPFGQNLDGDFGCLRYYCKSYSYAVAPGTASATMGIQASVPAGANNPIFPVHFKKIMAKAPTVTGYSPATGAINNVRDGTNSADRAVTAASQITDAGFNGFAVTGGLATLWQAQFNYTADTGW